MTIQFRALAKAALGALAGIALLAGPVLAAPQVTIGQGALEGAIQDGIASFKGIPFAAPPVGDLRWRPPEAAAGWEGIRQATSFGPACPQPERADRQLGLTEQDEDCLTLNVYAPEDAENLPVMVWIHGGAFRLGSASLPVYDGSVLARHGVVVVTLNYRLGRFGFFAHPALTAESEDGRLGNYGLMDQIAALEWVRDNIAAFGGDADNVTIFGESAGGSSVIHLMIAPDARGLFHKAISQSGGGHNLNLPIGLETAETVGASWAESVGLPGAEANAEALRALDSETVLGAGILSGNVRFGPFVDGTVIPGLVSETFAEGGQAPMPMIVGANSFEGSLMAAFQTPPDDILAIYGDDLPQLREIYARSGVTGDLALAQQLYGDARFVAGARHVATSQAALGEPTYLYHMTYVTTRQRGQVPGAAHGADVPMVFGALDRTPVSTRLYSDEDRAMSESMRGYWTRFARTGDPNGAEAPDWPAFGANGEVTMILGEEIAPEEGFLKERLDFHQQRWEDQRTAP